MTVAYVMNQMIDRGPQEDNRSMEIVMAAYSGVHQSWPADRRDHHPFTKLTRR